MSTSFFIVETSKLNCEDAIHFRDAIFGLLGLIGLPVVSADLKQPETVRQGQSAIGAR
jgi:hypothetical protein